MPQPFRGRTLAMGTNTVDHDLDFFYPIVRRKLWCWELALRKTEDLTTAHAMKVRMRRMLGIDGTEAPDSVVGGDAVAELMLHQPFQAAIEGDPIDILCPTALNMLLNLGMTDRLRQIEQGLQNLQASTGWPLPRRPDSVLRFCRLCRYV